jgi:serine/threonine protein kinase
MTSPPSDPTAPRSWRPATSRDNLHATTRDHAAATATTRDAARNIRLATTRDNQPAGDGAPSEPAAFSAIRLPDYLDGDYDIADELPSGGEADVAVIRHRGNGSMKVIKIYRGGITLPQALIDTLAHPDPAHVLPVQRRLYDKWRTPRWIELMDYLPTGSLDALLQSMSQGAPHLANDILVEMTDALDYIHNSLKLVHRDVKPANILIRALNPFDLVLTDLGIAAEVADTRQSLRHTTGGVKGTLAYQAPETLNTSNAGAPRDWWALGMTLCEVLTGQHPFKDGRGNTLRDQNAIRDAITMGKIDLSMITDARWNLLCRGLLVHQPGDRWGPTQIRAWLAGDSPTVADNRIDDKQPGHQIGTYSFAGQSFTEPHTLADSMLAHWDHAAALFTTKMGCDGLFMWIRHDVLDTSIPANLFVPVANNPSQVDPRILEFTSHYRRGQDLIFRGTRITSGDLATRYLQAAESWTNDPFLATLTPSVTAAFVEAHLKPDAGPRGQSSEYSALQRFARYAGTVDQSIQDARHTISNAVSTPVGGTDVGTEVREALPTRSDRARAMARAALLSPECLMHIKSQFDRLTLRQGWFAKLCNSAMSATQNSASDSPDSLADADVKAIALQCLAIGMGDLVALYDQAKTRAEKAEAQRRDAEELAAAAAFRQHVRAMKRGPLIRSGVSAIAAIVGLFAHQWATNRIHPVGGFPQTWVYAVLRWPSVQLQVALLVLAATASIGLLIYIALEQGAQQFDTPATIVAGVTAIGVLPLLISLALGVAIIAFGIAIVIGVVVGLAGAVSG